MGNNMYKTILTITILLSSQAHGASFDCAKASTFVEKAICTNPKLSRQDEVLGENYKSMSASNIGDGARKDLKETQRTWIVDRNKCTDNECITNAYRKRIDQICDYPVLSGAHPTCTSADEVEAEFSKSQKGQTAPSSSTATAPFLIIKAIPQTTPDKGIKSRSPVEITGKIEFGHDAAGGKFQITGGKKKQYTLGYVWDLDDATQEKLGKLDDASASVTAKGMLKVWNDGSASFDNAFPISIFK